MTAACRTKNQRCRRSDRPVLCSPLLNAVETEAMKTKLVLLAAACGLLAPGANAATPDDGSVLPFPPTPSASIAGKTLQESKHVRRVEPKRLRDDAPNILIILLDDVGFGLPDTFGGEIHTPTLTRLRDEGISYNAFHTTSICSPTRAALLTGRNHQRVGSGTIAERAVDWDGYTGVIPKTSATIAEVLEHYGYKTAAFGKWHNTPADRDHRHGAVRPLADRPRLRLFLRLPRRRDLAVGAAAVREPQLRSSRRTTTKYHLSEDLADKAIAWLRRHRAYLPRQAVLHVLGARRRARPAPHLQGVGRQVQRQVRRRLGRDARARLHAAEGDGLDPGRHRADPARRDHGRLGQHPRGRARLPAAADGGVCRLRRARRRPGRQGDRRARPARACATTRSSSTSSATTARAPRARTAPSASCSRRTASRTRSSSNSRRWRSSAGSTRSAAPKIDNMYHAGWAWAGNTPFQHTKLIASHFGGTRNPLVDLLARAASSPTRRRAPQFHHVNDIAPTIYEMLGITPPQGGERLRAGPDRRRQHGLHVRRADGARAQERRSTSTTTAAAASTRTAGIACTFGPLMPWLTGGPGLANWDAEQGRLGALRPQRRTSRRPTTSPPRSRSGWPR